MALKYISFNIFQDLFCARLSSLICILFSTNRPNSFYQYKCCCATRVLRGHQGQSPADRNNISVNSFHKPTKLCHKKRLFFLLRLPVLNWNTIARIFKNPPLTSCLSSWTIYLCLFLFQQWPIEWIAPLCLSTASPPIQLSTISTYFYLASYYS